MYDDFNNVACVRFYIWIHFYIVKILSWYMWVCTGVVNYCMYMRKEYLNFNSTQKESVVKKSFHYLQKLKIVWLILVNN